MVSNSAKRRQRIKEQSKEVANYMNRIQPPPELVEQWANHSASVHRENGTYEHHELAIATQSARWGADQELEACIKLLSDLGGDGEMIRRYRRPKPPSLKEQALEALDEEHADMRIQNYKLIRSVLESLPD